MPITESKSWRGPQGIASMSPANVPERRETWSRFRGPYKVKKWGCTKLESRAGALGGSAFASMLGITPENQRVGADGCRRNILNGCGRSLGVWGEDRDLGEHVGGWKLKIRLGKTAAAETEPEE